MSVVALKPPETILLATHQRMRVDPGWYVVDGYLVVLHRGSATRTWAVDLCTTGDVVWIGSGDQVVAQSRPCALTVSDDATLRQITACCERRVLLSQLHHSDIATSLSVLLPIIAAHGKRYGCRPTTTAAAAIIGCSREGISRSGAWPADDGMGGVVSDRIMRV